MSKALFVTITLLSIHISLFSQQAVEEPLIFTEEDEALITDKDRGSREKPTLYDYNRQNVEYNRRYDSNSRGSSSYSNDRVNSSDRFYDDDSFNKSYIQDNTSPYLYKN